MLQVQSFFPRLGQNAVQHIPHPPGWISGAWIQQRATAAGAYARYMGPVPGKAQKEETQIWGTIPNAVVQGLGVAQFCSDPLGRQSVAAGVWTVAYGAILTNAGATFAWEGNAALFICSGLTGQKRATVFDFAGIGAVRVNNTETTIFQTTVAGAAFEIFTGDYLCLELGLAIQNTTGAGVVPVASIFCDGATPITADIAATADARAALLAPVPFTLSVPLPGDLPAASMSFDESVEACKAAWPPGTFHDFDDPEAPDFQLIRFFGQTFKTFLFDLLDLMEREMDPSRAALKLQDFRRLFGMPQNPPLEELRALVIARWREYGGPSNPFDVASAVGVVLGYADPTQLELLEFSPAQLRSVAEFIDTLPGAGTVIPAGAAFDGTNLVRRTPHIMDGGAVWDSGALLTLNLNAPAGTQINAQLTGPDGTVKQWSPLTLWDPRSTVVLFGKEFAFKSPQGNWQLNLFRTGGAAVSLLSWQLFAPGAPRAYVGPKVALPLGPVQPRSVPNVVKRTGLGQWKFWWGAFANPGKISATTTADFGAARQTLSRMRHAYQKADLILSKKPIPDKSTTLPDSCVPWDGLPF